MKAYSRKKIIDEFCNLPVSRQRKYQLRKKALGLCVTCGRKRPEFLNARCLECAIKVREFKRHTNHYIKRYNSATYKVIPH